MADLSQLKEELSALLTNGEIKKFVNKLQTHLMPGTEVKRDLVGFGRKFNIDKNDYNKGKITREEYHASLNRISEGLTELLDSIVEDDLLKSDFYKKNRIISRLKYYTCDRQKVKNKFKYRLRDKIANKQSCQFYFLLGTREQMPGSLVNRLVFEELDKSEWKLRYEMEDNLVNHQSIKIHEFPQDGLDIDQSKFEIREKVESTFGYSANNLQDLLESNPTLRQYDYIIRVFGLKTSKHRWKPFTFELFDWIISEYCKIEHSYNTNFLLFFIFYLEPPEKTKFFNFLSRRNQFRVEELFKLEQKYPEKCTCLPELQFVERVDFEDWLQKHIFDRDLMETQKYVERIIKELKKDRSIDWKNNYDKKNDRFTMSLVESKIRELLDDHKQERNPIKKR